MKGHYKKKKKDPHYAKINKQINKIQRKKKQKKNYFIYKIQSIDFFKCQNAGSFYLFSFLTETRTTRVQMIPFVLFLTACCSRDTLKCNLSPIRAVNFPWMESL